jgi:hypothetical protein
MKKIEILSAEKEVVVSKVNELKNQLSQLESVIADEKRKIVEIAFSSELESYDKVQVKISEYDGNAMFMIDDKEIASLNKRHWYGSSANTVELNYYMTRCDNEFEFKRMMFIGKLSEKVLYNQESILHVLSNKSRHDEEYSNLKNELYKLEREVNELEYSIQEVKKQDIIDALMTTGVDWSTNTKFELAARWITYGMKHIKIVSSTKSGKTVDVECVFERNEWDKDYTKMTTTEEVRSISDIKMNYVLSNFSDQIYGRK